MEKSSSEIQDILSIKLITVSIDNTELGQTLKYIQILGLEKFARAL